MRFLAFPLLAALALCACATVPSSPASSGIAMDADTGSPSKADTIAAVATSAAAVADAIGQAPPATLSTTTIDDQAVHAAYVSFDRALDVVDAFVEGGTLRRGSSTALAVRRGILTTQAALNAASAAQRAGSAITYKAALRNAQVALADVQAALSR